MWRPQYLVRHLGPIPARTGRSSAAKPANGSGGICFAPDPGDLHRPVSRSLSTRDADLAVANIPTPHRRHSRLAMQLLDQRLRLTPTASGPQVPVCRPDELDLRLRHAAR